MVNCTICNVESTELFCRQHLAMIPLDLFRLLYRSETNRAEIAAVAATIIRARLRAAEKFTSSPLKRLYDGTF